MRLRFLEKIVDKTYEQVDTIQTFSRCIHASYLVRKNNILSVGWNDARKTHPLAKKLGFRFLVIHSEFDAIRKFPMPPRELEKCTLINVRIGNDGKLRISRPCQVCQRMLYYFGINEVYYTDDRGVFCKL